MPIDLPAGSKIYLSLSPVDMRKGFLAAQVQHFCLAIRSRGICFCSAAAAVTA